MAWLWWALWIWLGVLVVALALNAVVALVRMVIERWRGEETTIDLRTTEERADPSEPYRAELPVARRKTHHLRTR